MKINKKLIMLSVLSIFLANAEAKSGLGSPKKGNQEMVSMEQLQEMEQMQQLWNLIIVMMTVKFIEKFPKFVTSLVSAYAKKPSVAEEISVQQFEAQFDPMLAEVVKALEIDKNMVVMLTEFKPLLKQMFVQEIIKWVHITATSKIKIQ